MMSFKEAIFAIVVGVALSLFFNKMLRAEELPQTYNLNLPIGMKVVPVNEVCTKPNPCEKKEEPKKEEKKEPIKEQIADLHKKLSYECPKCSKASVVYVDKIIEKPIYKTIERNIEIPKIVEKRVEVERPVIQHHSLYLLVGLGPDGIEADEAGDRQYVYWAQTYYAPVASFGYSYQFGETLGLMGMVQTNRTFSGGIKASF